MFQCAAHAGPVISDLHSARGWVASSALIFTQVLDVPRDEVRAFTADYVVRASRYRETRKCCAAAAYAEYLLTVAFREYFSRDPLTRVRPRV